MVKNKILNEDFYSCWVCESRFIHAYPPGQAHMEEHHVFPRNAGGTDGPLVKLCTQCHTSAHKIALKLHAKKPYQALLVGNTALINKRLLWLAVNIYKAEKLVEKDPNKPLAGLPREDRILIDKLKSIFPGKGGNDIVHAALVILYKKYFE